MRSSVSAHRQSFVEADRKTDLGSPTFGFCMRCALFLGSAKKLDAGTGCLKMDFAGLPNVRAGGGGAAGADPYPKQVPSRYLHVGDASANRCTEACDHGSRDSLSSRNFVVHLDLSAYVLIVNNPNDDIAQRRG